MNGHVYLREWSGGLLGGGFEPLAKPVFHDGVPEKFEHQLLNEDWDHFRRYILKEPTVLTVSSAADASADLK